MSKSICRSGKVGDSVFVVYQDVTGINGRIKTKNGEINYNNLDPEKVSDWLKTKVKEENRRYWR